jgi:hypothetical protein
MDWSEVTEERFDSLRALRQSFFALCVWPGDPVEASNVTRLLF